METLVQKEVKVDVIKKALRDISVTLVPKTTSNKETRGQHLNLLFALHNGLIAIVHNSQIIRREVIDIQHDACPSLYELVAPAHELLKKQWEDIFTLIQLVEDSMDDILGP